MGHKRKKIRKVVPGDRHVAIAPRDDRRGGGAPEFEVRIRISKRPKVDHYSGDIEATNTTALIEALAVLIQKAADMIGAPTERVYAVIATLLFAETSSVSPDGADTFPKGEGTEGMED